MKISSRIIRLAAVAACLVIAGGVFSGPEAQGQLQPGPTVDTPYLLARSVSGGHRGYVQRRNADNALAESSLASGEKGDQVVIEARVPGLDPHLVRGQLVLIRLTNLSGGYYYCPFGAGIIPMTGGTSSGCVFQIDNEAWDLVPVFSKYQGFTLKSMSRGRWLAWSGDTGRDTLTFTDDKTKAAAFSIIPPHDEGRPNWNETPRAQPQPQPQPQPPGPVAGAAPQQPASGAPSICLTERTGTGSCASSMIYVCSNASVSRRVTVAINDINQTGTPGSTERRTVTVNVPPMATIGHGAQEIPGSTTFSTNAGYGANLSCRSRDPVITGVQ